MNKTLNTLLLTVSILVCFSLQNRDAMGHQHIVVVGNHAPPYRIIEGDQFSGIYFDVIKEIGNRLNIAIVFREEPFKRALNSMERGTADLMCGPNKTPERQEYMVYLNATFPRANKAFYVHPEMQEIEKYSDLQGKVIAVKRGQVYFSQFDQDTSLTKEVVNEYQFGIKKVALKRNDVVIMPEAQGGYLLKELGISLKKSPYIVEGNVSYITISKKSHVLQLRPQIEEAMHQMHADGTIQKISERYYSTSP